MSQFWDGLAVCPGSTHQSTVVGRLWEVWKTNVQTFMFTKIVIESLQINSICQLNDWWVKLKVEIDPIINNLKLCYFWKAMFKLVLHPFISISHFIMQTTFTRKLQIEKFLILPFCSILLYFFIHTRWAKSMKFISSLFVYYSCFTTWWYD